MEEAIQVVRKANAQEKQEQNEDATIALHYLPSPPLA